MFLRTSSARIKAELLAVLGDIGKARVDRRGNAGEVDLAAVERGRGR